jgi:hypothetical protein
MSTTKTEGTIVAYMERMNNDMIHVRQMLADFDKDIAVLKEQIASPLQIVEFQKITEEVLERMCDSRKNLHDWIKEFEIELIRVSDAYESLNSSDPEVVKAGFTKFVLNDTAFSVKNTAMMFYDTREIWDMYKSLLVQIPLSKIENEEGD